MNHYANWQVSVCVCLCLLLAVACSTEAVGHPPSGNKVRINPRLPEEQIRREILKYTPVGCTEDKVIEFGNNRLVHVGEGPLHDRPDQLNVLLGTYGWNPFGRNDTWVQWSFDPHHKLVGVYVEKSRDSL